MTLPERLTDGELRLLLDSEAQRINSPAFIADDPVQFPRRFTSLPDIEIAALLSATIAWGNRKMICRNCHRMLDLMENRPHAYLMDEGYEELPPEGNIHRTFFNHNLAAYLRGLRRIYSAFPSLADFARSLQIGASEAPAWKLVEAINSEIAIANGGSPDPRCLPQNLRATALKRVNMALRWLVRDDGIVDLGVWKGVITPAQLFIPLDVHVGDTARDLGLLTRRTDDRRAVEELTGRLRAFRPDDPVIYDFALFGIGMRL
ncbi:MAG: TIGR02757 family protein [Muribaculaceae bacterium]|nr:TIGR02757 family protein [Muribaculaceae bacterium]